MNAKIVATIVGQISRFPSETLRSSNSPDRTTAGTDSRKL